MNIGVIGFGIMGEGLVNYLSAFQDVKKYISKQGTKKNLIKKYLKKN